MAEAPASLSAALADRYRVEREVGSGGMATVYLAHDVRHDRKVALKLLRPELAAVLGAERFLNEIRITAKLDHPHILTLIDSGAVDGLLYYVLPYVRGESLRDKLEREKQLSVDEALEIARQVASALDYAHRQGVVHRDIKPENILIHEGEAIVADFGIALAMREAGGARLTETGLSLGTPQYMSPEQATGDRQIDKRSDIYSLAAVLYEMLAGEPPVTGPTVQAVIAKLLTERPTRLLTVRDTVPVQVDAAVAKALAKVPADRFASAAEFATALVLAPGDAGAPERRTPRPRVAAAVGAAAVLLAVGVWAVLRFALGSGAPAPVDVPRIQVTFTGAASVPALSPDGQRVAYAERTCTAGEPCTQALVIQDVGGAGVLRVVEGYPAIYEIEWSPDARYVKFTGTRPDGRYGDFIVPALGGSPPRFLTANGTDFLSGTDSLLLTSRSPDGALWVGIATMADARLRDSLRVAIPGLRLQGAEPSPDGRWLVVRGEPLGGGAPRLLIADRRGTAITDSLVLPRDAQVLGWGADNQGVLVAVPDSVNSDFVRIEQRPVERDGRFAGRTAVLLPSQPLLYASASAGGIAYAAGASGGVIYAATRPGPRSDRLDSRQVVRSTGAIRHTVSPDGRWIGVTQRLGAGERAAWRLSLAPFEGGTEVTVSEAIAGYLDQAWTTDGGRWFYVARDRDRARVVEVDPVSGKSRDAGVVPDSLLLFFVVLRTGELAWPHPGGAQSVRIAAPGAPAREIPVDVEIEGLRASPFDDGLMVWGWSLPDGDSLVVLRLDPATGRATRIAAAVFEGAVGYHWLSPDVIEIVLRETNYTSALYHLHVVTGRFERIAALPFDDVAFIGFSNDGRRLAVRTQESRTDVWVARVFDSARR